MTFSYKKLASAFLLPFLFVAADAKEFIMQSGVRHFDLQMAEGASATKIEVRGDDARLALFSLQIVPDKDGSTLNIRTSHQEGGKMVALKKSNLIFVPAGKQAAAIGTLEKAGISPQGWKKRKLAGYVQLNQEAVRIWLEGRLVLNQPLDKKVSLNIVPGANTQLEWKDAKKAEGLYEIIPFRHLARNASEAELVEQSGVPFEVWDNGRSSLSLERAGWPEWESDPGSYYENYDANSMLYLMDGGQVPFIQVPKADYIAAHVLAIAGEKPGTVNRFTIRAGRQNGNASGENAQFLLRDFFAEVPYGSALQPIRVPMEESFAQNIEGDVLDIQITKELRLARRSPDPSRFRWRPLGLPSNVRIAAVTLEKSPIQMEVIAAESGALFVQPKPVSYHVRLANITNAAREAVVILQAGDVVKEVHVDIPAGETVEKNVVLEGLEPGHYELNVSLREKNFALNYRTALGVLPPDMREYRAEAPWGSWDFGGAHFTPSDSEQVGEGMHKQGLRYGMFRATSDARQRHGVVIGREFKIRARTKEPEKSAEKYAEFLKTNPDATPDFMLFHEDAISGSHATRVPDLFHDRPPYKLNEQEKERFQSMLSIAEAAAKSMREAYPDVKIHLGNGGHALREEFYRNKFPAELFDTAGNESAGFGRPPESQSPDGVAINAALWMDRQLLDAYGYGDKSVSQAYEVIYPGTNPGNLSLRTQANYFVRHILHAMAWRIPKIRPGSIADVGNSYYQSNWGATGFMYGRYDWTPKPSAIALATLTQALDGAGYEGFMETGSDSAYLLHFRKKDGSQVFPFWVIRGEREYVLEVEGANEAKLISQNGRTENLSVRDGKLHIVATASPAWLQLSRDASIKNVALQSPQYPGSEPDGKISELNALASLDGWRIEEKPSALLNHYNPMTPRRKGNFAFESVERFEGSGPALKVTPQPLGAGKPTMPMVVEIVSEKKIELPGKPAEIGLWVNGNSSWGRIIFELEDASGQRWTSIGVRSKGGSAWMADWLGEELSADFTPGEIADWNTDDAWGLSRINFDGWRYVGFPLPGQYPGEGYHWPVNSQWRADKDGIVHYPLVLKKVILELPEKTLYLTRYEPPKRREIYLHNLISIERDINAPKTSTRDYVEEAQILLF